LTALEQGVRGSSSAMRLLCLSLWFSFLVAVVRSDAPPKNSVGDLEEETGFYQAIEVTDDSPIYDENSKFQDIKVYKASYFGKILMLDGVLQLTERDADSYNEMMAQMAMMRHKNPKRALVIGGGDGYVLSEVRIGIQGGSVSRKVSLSTRTHMLRCTN